MAVISTQATVADPWQWLKAGDAVPATGDVLVPLATWREQRDALLARSGRVGIWLDSDQDPADIADDLGKLSLVGVNFPKFTDGRGYSTARLLRERYGWRGELRALGDVLRDQLYEMARVGFDSFALRADQDVDTALGAFRDFSEAYQTAVDRPQPLFRRRLAQAR